jgi:hypothetical protein
LADLTIELFEFPLNDIKRSLGGFELDFLFGEIALCGHAECHLGGPTDAPGVITT